jgi:hypothetical protein
LHVDGAAWFLYHFGQLLRMRNGLTISRYHDVSRIKGPEACRIERCQVDRPRGAVKDQLNNSLRGRGSVQNTPNAVARSDIGSASTCDGANQWQSVCVSGR